MKLTDGVAQTLKPLSEAPLQAWLTTRIQIADLLRWVLEQTGPASVQMTSFSISEEFIRRLWHLKREGLITHIELILDFKATNKTVMLWPFIQQVIECCHLADNHSKLLTVTNDTYKVCVVTSQNLTRGNRHECGMITVDPALHAQIKAAIDDIIKQKSIPLHDLYARAIDDDTAAGSAVHLADGNSDNA